MSLLNILRAGVKIADRVTKPLQATVTFTHFANPPDLYGTEPTVTSTTLRAIVDWKQRQLRTMQGELTVSRASVLFLDIAALVAATNGAGIDDHDVIVLPDGTTGPILDMSGFIDAGTGHPIATEVFLG